MEETEPISDIESSLEPKRRGKKREVEKEAVEEEDEVPLAARTTRMTRSKASPPWTTKDALFLVNEIAAMEREWMKVFSSHQKWKIVADNCYVLDTRRNLHQCREKWSSLLSEYNRIKQWNSKAGQGRDPYWTLECEKRKLFGLPVSFDDEVFKAIDTYVRSQTEDLDTDTETDPEADAEFFEVIARLGSKSKRRKRSIASLEKEEEEEEVFPKGLSSPSSPEEKPPPYDHLRNPDESRTEEMHKEEEHTHETHQPEVEHTRETYQPKEVEHTHETCQPEEMEHTQELRHPEEVEHTQELRHPEEVEHTHETHQPEEVEHTHETHQPGKVGHTHETHQPRKVEHTHETHQPEEVGHTHKSRQPEMVVHTHESPQPEEVEHINESCQSEEEHAHCWVREKDVIVKHEEVDEINVEEEIQKIPEDNKNGAAEGISLEHKAQNYESETTTPSCETEGEKTTEKNRLGEQRPHKRGRKPKALVQEEKMVEEVFEKAQVMLAVAKGSHGHEPEMGDHLKDVEGSSKSEFIRHQADKLIECVGQIVYVLDKYPYLVKKYS
ncbi:110 kDa antigen (Fragment) [Linum perenne]